METTATLDQATDEWVINCPSIQSSKFWPGEIGRISTHAVAMCKTIVNGRPIGVHPFLVQLRDLNTFQWLPGVETGDLGMKFGLNSLDQGWARFENVRIPRRQMLMSLCHVDQNGRVKLQGNPKAMYCSMMLVRNRIVHEMNIRMFEACTTTLRYAAVRRQF